MSTIDTRETVLTSFDQARAGFVAQLQSAPEASLRYLKAGDDYALGGLVYHVNAVLEHYLGALDAIASAGFAETEARDRPGLFEEANARAKLGVTTVELSGALTETARLHEGVRARLAAFPAADFERRAPVRLEAGAEPYLTSPADVAGWLTGHYEEHVPHVQQLLESWEASR
ncbi:MAG: DinB family protein [Candidatus Dormibacteraeota bacterium]|nr:DinB family protein [Candidatus Dormibacteraeota bacterium]